MVRRHLAVAGVTIDVLEGSAREQHTAAVERDTPLVIFAKVPAGL